MSKTCCLTHIVFATKHRARTIPFDHKRELYAYICGTLQNLKCFVHRINGMSDHIHILIDLHPSIALSEIVKTVKQSSAYWICHQPQFNMWEGWQEGYFAVSVSPDALDSVKSYVKGQENHHKGKAFYEEMEWLSLKNRMKYYREDWE